MIRPVVIAAAVTAAASAAVGAVLAWAVVDEADRQRHTR